jgi:hypothetical protein
VDQIQELFNADRTRLNRPNISDLQRLAVDPRLIGPDGRANPQYLLPNTTPGDFGQIIFLRDRNTYTWNVSMTKAFKIKERTRFEFFASFNNVLNHPRWGFPTADVFSTTFGVVGAPSGNRTINLRGTLSF